MTRPELKNYQTKAFHHFDMEKYAKDLNAYIDHLENYKTETENLLETYKRRLEAIGNLIDETKDHFNGSIYAIKKDERLKTKESEYRTIISELERIVKP